MENQHALDFTAVTQVEAGKAGESGEKITLRKCSGFARMFLDSGSSGQTHIDRGIGVWVERIIPEVPFIVESRNADSSK